MRLLGAEVVVVDIGSRTLKDAINEAMRYWVAHEDDTYYCFGTAAGPHPFPQMVRDLQRVIGAEARQQILEQEGRLPDAVVACVGGGSNAIGLFHRFITDESVALVGAEAAGDGVETGRHAAPITVGRKGVFQGAYSDLMQDEDGQITDSHSISAGLDYPGVGPEHSALAAEGGPSTSPSRTPRRWRPSAPSASPRASSRPSSPPTPSPRPGRSRRSSPTAPGRRRGRSRSSS